jgi:hypothetical protein
MSMETIKNGASRDREFPHGEDGELDQGNTLIFWRQIDVPKIRCCIALLPS